MATTNRKIVELASIISENTAKIHEYLTSNAIPEPSFEISAPIRLDLPKELQAARDAVLDANMELSELLLGPKEVVVDYQVRQHISGLYRAENIF